MGKARGDGSVTWTTTKTAQRDGLVTWTTIKRRAAKATRAARGGSVYAALAKLLDTLVHQYGGTKRSFADHVHCSYSQLTHWMNPARTEPGPGVAACIRIAHHGHCSLVRVLYAAGHPDYAIMIEAMYGEPDGERRDFGRRVVSAAEVRHLDDWRKLTEQEKRIHTTLIQAAHIARAAMPPASSSTAQKQRA